MKTNKYDIVVVGAGPAGSICARDLARKGYRVLLCEKRPVVGVPVRCGEAVETRARMSDFISLNEDYIETDMDGIIIHNSHSTIKYDSPGCGLMLDRALFDQDLSRQAKEAGSELCLNSRVSGLSPANGDVRGLQIIKDGREHQIQASMVVAADGVETLCGRWAGLNCRQMPGATCSAIEFKLKGEDKHPNHLSFWTNYSGIDNGYVWVFPKVKSGTINLGCGKITPKLNEPNMHDELMKFKDQYFPEYEILSILGGAVPISGNLAQTTADRLLLVGDAAHHTNPLTGGGIVSAMSAAVIAAKWIDAAFTNNNFSREFFRQYEEECWDKVGKYHQKQMQLRNFILGLSPLHEKKFYAILKDMVDSNFSLFAKIKGAGLFLWLVIKNFKRILQIIKK